MAVRTTDELVEGIIDVESAIVLTPFIAAANALVTQCCTNLTIDYTAAHLIIIETWLAAHFYTVREMRSFEERAGTVSERKQSKVDLGFATSHYGQMAMTLDFYGGLSALNEMMKKGRKRSPGVTWLGKTEDEMGTTLDT